MTDHRIVPRSADFNLQYNSSIDEIAQRYKDHPELYDIERFHPVSDRTDCTWVWFSYSWGFFYRKYSQISSNRSGLWKIHCWAIIEQKTNPSVPNINAQIHQQISQLPTNSNCSKCNDLLTQVAKHSLLFNDSTKKLNVATNKLADVNARLQNVTKEKEDLFKQLSDVKDKHEQCITKQAEIIEQVAVLNSIKSIENVMKSHNENETTKINQIINMLDSIKLTNTHSNINNSDDDDDEIATLKQDNQRLKNQHEACEKQNTKYKKEIKTLTESKKNAIREKEEAICAKEEAIRAKEEAIIKLKENEDEIAALKQDNQRLKNQYEACEKQNTKYKKEIKTLTESKEEVVKRMKQLEDRLKNAVDEASAKAVLSNEEMRRRVLITEKVDILKEMVKFGMGHYIAYYCQKMPEDILEWHMQGYFKKSLFDYYFENFTETLVGTSLYDEGFKNTTDMIKLIFPNKIVQYDVSLFYDRILKINRVDLDTIYAFDGVRNLIIDIGNACKYSPNNTPPTNDNITRIMITCVQFYVPTHILPSLKNNQTKGNTSRITSNSNNNQSNQQSQSTTQNSSNQQSRSTTQNFSNQLIRSSNTQHIRPDQREPFHKKARY